MSVDPEMQTTSVEQTARRRPEKAMIFVLAIFSFTAEWSHGGTKNGTKETLNELVHSFFLEDHAGRRTTIRSLIEEASDRSFDAVAQAVRGVSIWPELTHQTGAFTIGLPSGQVVRINYSVPPAYDPLRAYPMILCYFPHDRDPNDEFPSDTLDAVLGSRATDFVLVYLSEPIANQFYETVDTGYDLPSLLVELRHMFHIDADRTFLFLDGPRFAHRYWLAPAKHPDVFAGVICESHSPIGLHWDTTDLFLLHNLHSTPWLWRDPDSGSSRLYAVSDFSEVFGANDIHWGTEMDHPSRSKAGSLESLLIQGRKRPRRFISFWFRYPGQGEVEWLKQKRFAEPVWNEEQLSARPAKGVDFRDFYWKTLEGLMAYLGAQVEDQAITIQTRKCAQIEVTLPIDLVDLSKPVTIFINGRRRHHRKIMPRIRVLLDTAYKRWDFQDLAAARLSFKIQDDSQAP